MGVTEKKKRLIAFKTWLWERHDISVPNRLVNEYLSLGVPRMVNPPPPPSAVGNGESSENSLHKHNVSNSVCTCGHWGIERVKYCTKCGKEVVLSGQTDC